MADVQTLMTSLVMGESPRWQDDRLWLSDMGAGEVIAVDRKGRSEVVARVPNGLAGIGFLPDGELLIVANRDGLLLRLEPDGSLVTHADLTGVFRPPWSDLVMDGRGNAYISNVGFDFPGGAFAAGIVALVTTDGSARQVADGFSVANGLAVTPDNSTLIVAESYGSKLTAFDIGADGGLSKRRVWADLAGDHPDGICIDAEGAVWSADAPAKHCVRVREGGEVLQTIDFDLGCFVCVLGGVDGRTLFVTAAEWPLPQMTGGDRRTGQVVTLPAPAPAAGWP
jgi:sugar lactone lactonase YvrE